MNIERIYLVGFMGSGKTTIGPLAAERLGWSFVDLDARIELREGRSIADIFRDSGEPYFRAVESEVLRLTAEESGAVVALGGGAYVLPGNRDFVESHGLSVYLHAAIESILGRIRDDGSRPLLGGAARIADLYRERLPLYRMAGIAIDTDRESPEEAADLIARLARQS